MDKSTCWVSSLFITTIRLVYLSYIFWIADANAASTILKKWIYQDNFYRPTLYRENYILPYHRLEKAIKPRPNTMIRTGPIFKKRYEQKYNQGKSNEQHQQFSHDNSKRHAMLLSETVLPNIHSDYVSPIEQYKDSLNSRQQALKYLEGSLMQEKESEALEEFLHILHELLRFNYMDNTEVAFQVSLKIPLWRFNTTDTRFYAAYTQQSWWQCYTKVSAFFRENDYCPELFIEQPFKIKSNHVPSLTHIKVGFIHESNGVGIFLERSWNRIFAEIGLKWGHFLLFIEPWYPIEMDTQGWFSKDNIRDNSQPRSDLAMYNPDILKHVGYGRVKLQFKYKFLQSTVQWKKSSYQILGSIAFSKSLNCTFCYFKGKGLSLGLLDEPNTAWGIGIGVRL